MTLPQAEHVELMGIVRQAIDLALQGRCCDGADLARILHELGEEARAAYRRSIRDEKPLGWPYELAGNKVGVTASDPLPTPL